MILHTTFPKNLQKKLENLPEERIEIRNQLSKISVIIKICQILKKIGEDIQKVFIRLGIVRTNYPPISTDQERKKTEKAGGIEIVAVSG